MVFGSVIKRMEFPELSLAPTQPHNNKVNMPFDQYSESNASRKRKLFHDHALIQPSVDLHLKDPLPLDWEQCLDLESGKMYYLNRKTLKKSWNWPIPTEQQQQAAVLDLELNISTHSDHAKRPNHSFSASNNNNNNNNNYNHKNNMVALACLNCHLLVILSKSSPACPNCKYVHSLPSHSSVPPPQEPRVAAAVKTLNTLSLLN